MVATELGACEWFIWDLRRSNLIERTQLDQILADFLHKNPRAEPPVLAEHLQSQGLLTSFQTERLLQGKTQGFVLGPFTLMDALGAGSLGTVYKAQSRTDNKWYAVKVLPRRSMWNVRIARRKVKSFEQVRHASVVPFVDVGTAGGMHYLAWPFVEGELLEKLIARQGKVKASVAAQYALQIAEGLDACHQHGLIHGLLKPSNLMISGEHHIKILDFGIGCLLAESEGESLVDTMSTANAVTSGLDCASPESIMDPTNLTPVGDQYSLGCVFYYMLTGQYPFPEGAAPEKMMAHQFKQPTPIAQLAPDVPAEFARVVERLMQKAPENRYAAMADVIAVLKPLSLGQGLLPHSAPAPLPAKPPIQATTGPRQTSSVESHLALEPKSAPIPAIVTGAGFANSSVAASAPSEPKPGTKEVEALPSRGTLFAASPPNINAAAEPETPAADADSESYDYDEPLSFEDRFGVLGVAVSTFAICALVYYAAVWLHIL